MILVIHNVWQIADCILTKEMNNVIGSVGSRLGNVILTVTANRPGGVRTINALVILALGVLGEN